MNIPLYTTKPCDRIPNECMKDGRPDVVRTLMHLAPFLSEERAEELGREYVREGGRVSIIAFRLFLEERVPELVRERLGRIVREVWVAWAREQPSPKPSWLLPWEELSEEDREVDRRIGERLAEEGRRMSEQTSGGIIEQTGGTSR